MLSPGKRIEQFADTWNLCNADTQTDFLVTFDCRNQASQCAFSDGQVLTVLKIQQASAASTRGGDGDIGPFQASRAK